MRVCKCVMNVIGLSLLATVALAQSRQPVYGGDTPQTVVAGLQQAIKTNDVVAAMPFVSPSGRRELATESISTLLTFLAAADPNDLMSGSSSLPKRERDAKRKAYRTAIDTARKALKPHRLDKVIGRPPMAHQTQQAIDIAVARADTVVLVRSLVSVIDRLGPLLGMQSGDRPRIPFTFRSVTAYRVNGDRATARAAGETLEFERIDARWYIRPPSPSTAKER